MKTPSRSSTRSSRRPTTPRPGSTRRSSGWLGRALRALRHPDADEAEHEANARLGALGIAASGWERVFELASSYAVAG